MRFAFGVVVEVYRAEETRIGMTTRRVGYCVLMTTTPDSPREPQEPNEPASEPTAPAESTIDGAGIDPTEKLGEAASDAPVDDDSPDDTAN